MNVRRGEKELDVLTFVSVDLTRNINVSQAFSRQTPALAHRYMLMKAAVAAG